jgi:hypothetical protein
MAVQLEERFQLQLSREEAVQYMQQLIDESVAAVFPQVTVSTAIALVASCRWLGWAVLTTDQSRTPRGRHAGRPIVFVTAPKAALDPVVAAALALQWEGYG